MIFQQVKEDLNNYFVNESIRNELSEEVKVNNRMSQTYSDLPRSKGGTSDSTSGEVFRRLVLECRIKKINERMEYIDKAMPVLNDFERQVVDYLKQGYKMSRIAVLLKCPRRKITYTRDAAISKIMQYTEQNQ